MSLDEAYYSASAIIGSERAECLEVARVVDKIREDHRPNRGVRVVLLAESHAWTYPKQVKSHVDLPKCMETRFHLPNNREKRFARFVYCLGAGERGLVKPSVPPNPSAHQFWTLFHDTVEGPDVSHCKLLKCGEPDLQRRVQNKLSLLREIRCAGIWLVDVSVTALYHPKRRLVKNNVAYKEILNVCWDKYVGGIVRGCKPSAILIVGKSVNRAIGDKIHSGLGAAKVEVVTINQPNARMDQEERAHSRRTCFELCRRHRA